MEGAAGVAPGGRVQGLTFAGASHFQLVPADSKGPLTRHSSVCLLKMWHLWEGALKKGQKLLERGVIKKAEK